MILEGENAVLKQIEELMGATDPKDAEEGTLSGSLYGVSIDKNSVNKTL